LENLEGKRALVAADADDPASGILAGVQNLLDNLDGDTATTTATTVDSASGVLNNVANLLGSLNGREAITYITTVNRTVSSDISRGKALGGVVGYANGGIPAELAEWGTERLHFANGGTALVHNRGIYEVPPNTYVSPNNAVGNGGSGGLMVQIDVHGNIYGIGDLAEQVTAQIVPAISEATGTRFREQGVSW